MCSYNVRQPKRGERIFYDFFFRSTFFCLFVGFLVDKNSIDKNQIAGNLLALFVPKLGSYR